MDEPANSNSKLEPAATIVRKFGGEKAIAELTATALTAPYRWQSTVERGGTGGLIPQRYHPILLKHARATGIDLRAEDFLPLDSEQAVAS